MAFKKIGRDLNHNPNFPVFQQLLIQTGIQTSQLCNSLGKPLHQNGLSSTGTGSPGQWLSHHHCRYLREVDMPLGNMVWWWTWTVGLMILQAFSNLNDSINSLNHRLSEFWVLQFLGLNESMHCNLQIKQKVPLCTRLLSYP